MKKLTTHEVHVALFFLWVALFLPWLVLAPFLGMAFEGSPTFGAYVFFLSTLTYPLVVVIAAIFRKRAPIIAFIPFLNVVTVGLFFLLSK